MTLREDVAARGAAVQAWLRWFLAGPWAQAEASLPQLLVPPGERDAADLRARFLATLARGQDALHLRLAVTVLLSLSALASLAVVAGEEVLEALGEEGFEALGEGASDGVGATALSGEALVAAPAFTAVLLGLRFALNRYLDLVSRRAATLAMLLASAPRARR